MKDSKKEQVFYVRRKMHRKNYKLSLVLSFFCQLFFHFHIKLETATKSIYVTYALNAKIKISLLRSVSQPFSLSLSLSHSLRNKTFGYNSIIILINYSISCKYILEKPILLLFVIS
jgi:hypothetical protein